MSRVEIASLIIPVPSIGGHINCSTRISVSHAPWQAAVIRCGARPETAPRAGVIRRPETRQAERSRLTQTLNAIRDEWLDYREAMQ